MTLPRLVVAAPASGHGKTTVATGLMAALRRAGHVVSGHKVGPDYIDPGYHALATGRPGRNLDPFLLGEDRVVDLLAHGAAGADVAVVEGVMGLHDGQLGTDGFASTAHVASLTRTPVVLVVDISHASRTIAATLHGLASWPSRWPVDVVGVILNKAGSTRHADEVCAAIGDSLPILGVLSRDDGIEAPSRHLGLVPAQERPDAAAALDRLAAQVAERVDLEAVLRLARSAPSLPSSTEPPFTPVQPVTSSRIAIAGGRAFTFRYAETEELLRARGCEVVEFDPLSDAALPEGTQGIYLGGGFPEMHAAELAANSPLLDDVRRAVAAGVPTVAECAGLLYLCRTVAGPDGVATPMAGAIEADAVMAPRLTLAYRTASAPRASLLGRPGERVTGHEFHRTTLRAPHGADPAWHYDLPDGPMPAGVATPTLHASYLHTHWAGHPQLADRFAQAAASTRPLTPARARTAPQPSAETVLPRGLRHHGDAEVDGLVDFAVNVYDGSRPDWLEKAIEASLTDIGRYPDASEAERAIAALHGRAVEDVLATAGAAEAFGLVARMRRWKHPVVVHPQFTEPDVALLEAGHRPRHVVLDGDFRLDPAAVPDAADLVVVGNPTNPTGVRHPAAVLRALVRPGRLVVVDEAFLDDGVESLAGERIEGLLTVRSLTKLWAVPGLRAGYLLASPDVVAALRDAQTPWSVSTPATAAMLACTSGEAVDEARRRCERLAAWRDHLSGELAERGIEHVPSAAPFVLARLGRGVRERLRDAGFAVRRADTFPGLDDSWARIAARPPAVTDRLLTALDNTR